MFMAHSSTRVGLYRSFLNYVIIKDLLRKIWSFNYMKVCTYNKFEYCKLFGYYLNICEYYYVNLNPVRI
jgi:hypothetical protein